MTRLTWQLVYTTQAYKDAEKLVHSGLRPKALGLLNILKINPYQNPPPYKKLGGGWKWLIHGV